MLLGQWPLTLPSPPLILSEYQKPAYMYHESQLKLSSLATCTKFPFSHSQVNIPDATVVINPPGALSSLINIYFDALDSTTAAELER